MLGCGPTSVRILGLQPMREPENTAAQEKPKRRNLEAGQVCFCRIRLFWCERGWQKWRFENALSQRVYDIEMPQPSRGHRRHLLNAAPPEAGSLFALALHGTWPAGPGCRVRKNL